MNARWAAAFDMLPSRLAAHLGVSAAALLLAILIAVPAVMAMVARPGLRRPVLGLASVIQTIPSLALLALFYPVLLALGSLTQRLAGFSVPALGFLPSLLALAMYALLPLLRGGADGLASVPPAVLEAADGIGMTRTERMLQVELPLAAPIVIGGLRTAVVWTIGAATLATTIGQASLGDLIFAGLQTEDWTLVLTGCLAAAGVTLLADFALSLVERGVGERSRGRIGAGIAILAVMALAALVPALAAPKQAARPLVVGAKNFGEQFILAELIRSRLAAGGRAVTVRSGLGSAVVFRALAAGDIDVYVDYSGTLWNGVLGHADTPPRAVLLPALTRQLHDRFGVITTGSLGFENAYALAMKRADAQRLGIASLADLARVAPSLRLATDLEFQARTEWTALQRVYGLRFKGLRAYSPTQMVHALTVGDADVITAFSSDGRIAADDLVVLTDPRGALPSYDAVVLIAPGRAALLAPLLGPLAGRIDVATMRYANWRVDRDAGKQTPAAAAAWLETRLGK